MACDLFVQAPRLETINGQQVLLARGGRQCTGGFGENEAAVILRIRHHRFLWPDRTLAETSGVDIALDLQAEFKCITADSIKVFTEVRYAGWSWWIFGAKKLKSQRVTVRCSK
jgi:hypothetical protein